MMEMKLVSFDVALAAMKKGKRVARKYWRNNGDVYIELEFVEQFKREIIVMQRRDERFPIDISCDSLLAEDWIILD